MKYKISCTKSQLFWTIWLHSGDTFKLMVDSSFWLKLNYAFCTVYGVLTLYNYRQTLLVALYFIRASSLILWFMSYMPTSNYLYLIITTTTIYVAYTLHKLHILFSCLKKLSKISLKEHHRLTIDRVVILWT